MDACLVIARESWFCKCSLRKHATPTLAAPLFSQQAHGQRRDSHRHPNSDRDGLKAAARRLSRAFDVLRSNSHANDSGQNMLHPR